MKKKILITDTLFILDCHVTRLEAAGFEVERLPKLKASESELIAALEGVSGYILGGIENVTAPVIKAADKLEAISFTGSGFSEFIPAHELATQRGIAITAAKGANAIDVAEFTIGLIFEMVRNFPLLRTRNQSKGNDFYIARRMRGRTLGVIGFGQIGARVTELAIALGMEVLVFSRTKPDTLPLGTRFVSLSELLANSDIVTVHVDKVHGKGLLGREELNAMKPDAVLINTAFPEAVDSGALKAKLLNKELRAAFDAPAQGDFADVDTGYYNFSNAQTAFNTQEAIAETSDRCTDSIINLLTKGNDVDVVNPDFLKFR